MRLICPNCDARYEVPDDAIPVGGREVQCSNCGHTWLERPGASDGGEGAAIVPPEMPPVHDDGEEPDPEPMLDPEEEDDLADAAAEPWAEPEPEPIVAPQDETRSDFVETDAADAHVAAVDPRDDEDGDGTEADDPAEEAVAPGIAAAAMARRQTVSPDVQQILREEAAREEAARRAARETFGTQEDLNLDAPPPPSPPDTLSAVPTAPVPGDEQRAEESRRRMARIKGEPAPPTSAAVTGGPAARRDLLPDIEEINSTLRPRTERAPPPAPEPTEGERREKEWRRGFRLGFGIVAIVMVLLAAVYIQAPRIAAWLPAAAPALGGYVEAVDEGRLWLDLTVQGFLDGDTAAADDAG
ncbi:zinc-ribbon domain-containing protein [Wenxinia marina]|uniref:Zinc-ribbon domain protein n=1 Tax=Wenxinia marina DSM 24838 TaxID=1123501 RepID=A0A0D0Q8S9_9RHOB|nr:zinc-ribbon domain-containing protein [Wenxinia marina]KIQ70809.1 zinc-ribbon domain protein [Wenxinia marina DSM 24838]GGL57141.1 hypothetical protein GCM10011392_09500 [Wenxinia marina]